MDSPPPSITPSSPLHPVLWPAADPSPSTLPCPDLLAGAAGATRRLVAAHSRHFLALSSLLLLPLALLLLALPSPLLLATGSSSSSHAAPSVALRSSLADPRWSPLSAPLLPLLVLVAAVLYLAAFAAAAASAHAGFFGRPVRLLASLRSVPASLLRLILTALPATPLLLIPLLPLPSPQLGPGLAVLGFVLLSPFWSLAGAAAVVESTVGLAPLRRSSRLLSGARLAALSAFLVFAAGVGVTLLVFGGVAAATYDGWAGMAPVVVKAVAGTALLALLMLYGMVANVVLCCTCTAARSMGSLPGRFSTSSPTFMSSCHLMTARTGMLSRWSPRGPEAAYQKIKPIALLEKWPTVHRR